MLGVKRTNRRLNTDIRKELGIKSLKKELEEKKLQWFEHMVRMEDKQVKAVWETKINRKRKRGIHRQTWNESVEN